MNWFTVGIGLVGGLSIGLTGVGAGSIINSLLLLTFPSLNLPIVIGTSAIEGAILKLLVSWPEYKTRDIHREQVCWMILGAIPATVLGSSLLLNWLNHVLLFRLILYFVIAVASLIIIGEAVLFRVVLDTCIEENLQNPGKALCKRKLVFWGALLGLIVGATSIGTGTLMVTTLLLILKFPIQRAVSLALWSGGIILWVAAITHILEHHLDWILLVNLMLGSVPGIFLGQYLRGFFPATPLRISVALLIFYLMSRNLLHM